jgi:hypothetical protein
MVRHLYIQDYDLVLTCTGPRSIFRRQEAKEEVVKGKGYVIN